MMGVIKAGHEAGGEGRQASATNGTLNPVLAPNLVLADLRPILDEPMIGNTKQEHIATPFFSPTTLLETQSFCFFRFFTDYFCRS